MTRNKRRHSTGFGYIGFGNNQNVFNQHSSKPFSVLKEKLNKETYLHYQLHFSHKELTSAEKEIIKNKIRKSEKKKSIKIIVTTIILTLILSVAGYKFLISPLINAFKS